MIFSNKIRTVFWKKLYWYIFNLSMSMFKKKKVFTADSIGLNLPFCLAQKSHLAGSMGRGP